MTRRDLSKAALLALGTGMTRRAFAQKTDAQKTEKIEPVTAYAADFILKTRYEDLPAEVIEPEDLQLGARVPPSALAADISAHLTLREARDEFEKQYILSKLKEFAGNVSRAADALGVERSNLYRKLHAYGIRVERP